MAWHLYIMPISGSGTKADPRRPKYELPGEWCMSDYGFQPVALVAADVDDPTDAALAANADVTKIPDNLDQQLGPGAVTAVQNALENRNLPAGWVAQALTYRQVLRTIYGFFAFLQRFSVISGNTNPVIGGSVTLETQFNQLPASARQSLRDTASSFGLDISGLSVTSPIRSILKSFADQWGQRSFSIGGIQV